MENFNVLYIKQDTKNNDNINIFFNKNTYNFHLSGEYNNIINLKDNHNIDLIIINFIDVQFNIQSFLDKLYKLHNLENIICIIDKNQNNINNIINSSNYTYLFNPFELSEFINKFNKIKDIIKLNEQITANKTLLNRISHKLRQPLSIISSSASSILLQKELNTCNEKNLCSILELIIDTTKNMSKSIDVQSI